MGENGPISYDDLRKIIPNKGTFSGFKNWITGRGKLVEPTKENQALVQQETVSLEGTLWYKNFVEEVKRDDVVSVELNGLKVEFSGLEDVLVGVKMTLGSLVESLGTIANQNNVEKKAKGYIAAAELLNTGSVSEAVSDLEEARELSAKLLLKNDELLELRGKKPDIPLQADLSILHAAARCEVEEVALCKDLMMALEGTKIDEKSGLAVELTGVREAIKAGRALAVSVVAKIGEEEVLLEEAMLKREERGVSGVDRGALVDQFINKKIDGINPKQIEFDASAVDVEDLIKRAKSLVSGIKIADQLVTAISLERLGIVGNELEKDSVLERYEKSRVCYEQAKKNCTEGVKHPETAVAAYLSLNLMLAYGSEMLLLESQIVEVVNQEQRKALLDYLHEFEKHNGKAEVLANKIMRLQSESGEEIILGVVDRVASAVVRIAERVKRGARRSRQELRSNRGEKVKALLEKYREKKEDAKEAAEKLK